MSNERVTVKLTGVPETLLWPLYGRASEAIRSDGLLRDSGALRLMESIDYPFVERFGRPSQVFALRARCFDKVVEEFLARYPDALVVSLGEGLETQFWRVDNGTVHRRSMALDGQRSRSEGGSATRNLRSISMAQP